MEYEIVKASFIHFINDSSPEGKNLISKALERLRGFIKASDPNLHYLGLEALQLLIANDVNFIQEFRVAVGQLFNSADSQIKNKALVILKNTVLNVKDFVSDLLMRLNRCSE